MKKILLFLIAAGVGFSFSSDKCLYNAQGVCEVKLQKDLYAINTEINPHKTYYIANEKKTHTASEYKKLAPRLQKSKKRWYEVDWNQGVKLCPEKSFNTGDGTWVINGSAHIDSHNCAYVDGSPYTRSILALFARNVDDLSDADSNWILVNQTIVELAGKEFQIWEGYAKTYHGRPNKLSGMKKIRLAQDLIVDKTELRVRDAIWLRDGKVKYKLIDYDVRFYPSADTLQVLEYPISPGGQIYLFQKWRSERDGLENVIQLKQINSVDTNSIQFVNLIRDSIQLFDTTANGYRMPTEQEWKVLQLGGSKSVFLWGDSASEEQLKKYANVKCATTDLGLSPVKQYAANGYGLYGVYGNAEEFVMKNSTFNRIMAMYDCYGYSEFAVDLGPACTFFNEYKCRERHTKNRLNIGTGFQGMRLVRKLE